MRNDGFKSMPGGSRAKFITYTVMLRGLSLSGAALNIAGKLHQSERCHRATIAVVSLKSHRGIRLNEGLS